MRIARTIPVAVLLAVSLPASLFAAEPLLFQFEQQAQRHCPDDSVVWTDAARHFYNVKGERWYGATKSGAYVCLRDGEKAGYHARLRQSRSLPSSSRRRRSRVSAAIKIQGV